jgi:hypothetical protein
VVELEGRVGEAGEPGEGDEVIEGAAAGEERGGRREGAHAATVAPVAPPIVIAATRVAAKRGARNAKGLDLYFVTVRTPE